MIAREDTEMNVAWGRVLIGIGVILAFLALAALEVFTARLPTRQLLVGKADSGHGTVGRGQDVLDVRTRFASHDAGAASVDEKSEEGRGLLQ
jgi:hypothetical protein